MNNFKIMKRLEELERKQEMLFIGVCRALEKLGIEQNDNLELFCMYRFSYEEFDNFKTFLMESSMKLYNENLSKSQFIDNYNTIFPDKKSLLPELMEIVDKKTDDFEQVCNLYFDRL
ncbi:hypothetical protein [Clostridium tetani]|uniref:hypothetical protein n=1 Tax=Clostridium tetani TaxID=1513 RepID=UPI000513C4EB|nr:hypothetical protein [Clostridium tetani]KGI36873.1 hypothetical protein LA33_12150 [Clostridium tetani ATCC 9441]KGI41523.1 hypothetical protein KY55_13790 [Clostridium tetani]RXI44020.1 hypothetical protein DP126_12490 [Clostridium tetani]RXI67882.1 hypothetical protein DP127_13860 [Clostridium tetani]RXM59573.1 hypothetical protein DP138_12765 [Clostridium tetani]